MSANPLCQIKQVIGIASGKGGTGKSLVTGLLATGLLRQGKSVAILDADIANPAIPQMFDLLQGVTRGEAGLYPALSDLGIRVISSSLLTEDDTDLITTRGATMAGIVEQFFADVIWDQVDALFIDLPPGIFDVTQLVFERLPLDGLILVTTPQAIVNQAVQKTARMAREHQVPILGVVENFSESFSKTAAGLPILDHLPLDPRLSAAADRGALETLETDYLQNTIQLLSDL